MAFFSKPAGQHTASTYFFRRFALCIVFISLLIAPESVATSRVLSPEDILSLSESQCVVAIVAFDPNILEQTTDDQGTDLLDMADVAFSKEPSVFVGTVDLAQFVWPSGKELNLGGDQSDFKAVVFQCLVKDRTCLQKPDYYVEYPSSVGYEGSISANTFINFVNKHCNTFRRPDGSQTHQGYHKDYLLENFFSVKELPDSVTISEMIKNQNHKKSNYCLKDTGSGELHCPELPDEIESLDFSDVPKCERIPVPSKEDFVNNYLARSRPVIITGAVDSWPALTKWTREFFMSQYGDKEVHIKLTPKGEFEGIEPAELWETHKTFKIPSSVLKQLPYPDLVVVRPAGLSMNFSQFLDLVKNISDGRLDGVSAYLEYTSITDYFPELQTDVAEMSFFENVLKLEHLNIWLSDGNTLGKAHFDPFDNFLCQISGEKEVTLFEPHNDRLYESHIPEAILSYNSSTKKFRRSTLLDSTSMVMTPVDILRPHMERFVRFGDARPMSCSIREGEVLFMPAFWWHEVQSRPSLQHHRNLALNFWYEPFFKKEFPCSDCTLDVNPKYNHLL